MFYFLNIDNQIDEAEKAAKAAQEKVERLKREKVQGAMSAFAKARSLLRAAKSNSSQSAKEPSTSPRPVETPQNPISSTSHRPVEIPQRPIPSTSHQPVETPLSPIQQHLNKIFRYNYKKHGLLTLDWRRINLNSKNLTLYVVVFEMHGDARAEPCWLIFKDWKFLENLDKMAFKIMGIFGEYTNLFL